MQVKKLIELLKIVPETATVYFGFRDERIDPDNPGYMVQSIIYLCGKNEQNDDNPAVVIRGE